MNDESIRRRVQPVILAGGSGTRLWPVSRTAYPKQFQRLGGAEPLFTQTLQRLDALVAAAIDCAPPLVVCNEAHRFLVAEHLRAHGVAGASILLEPVGRNTAPAIALTALQASATGADPLLLVLPADHAITDRPAFVGAVGAALERAQEGGLVTFGVVPTAPETGYGYIRAASPNGPSRVEQFVEKPDRATAQAYLADGCYYWNSGMFVFRASAILAGLELYAPAILEAVRRAHAGQRADLDFLRPEASAFAASPTDSIDYAVMELAERVDVIPLMAGWSDIGSWSAVREQVARTGGLDEQGNAVQGDTVLHQAEGCLVQASHRLVAAVGVRDLLIVETADAVLVAPLARAQEVRGLVDALRATGRTEPDEHRCVYRPWGYYEGLDLGNRFQVKRIVVKPGGRLSLQQHYHRAEHWVVVRGTAQITQGDDVCLLTENQSTYIPVGTLHRLENPGTIELELIEVQSGSYLGEDDIVRYDDQYGRP